MAKGDTEEIRMTGVPVGHSPPTGGNLAAQQGGVQGETVADRSAFDAGTITPFIGLMVGYVLESGPNTGQLRPAIVTNIIADKAEGKTVDLLVFTNGRADRLDCPYWAGHVDFGRAPQQWSFLETPMGGGVYLGTLGRLAPSGLESGGADARALDARAQTPIAAGAGVGSSSGTLGVGQT